MTPSWSISFMERAKAIPGQKKFVDRIMHFALSQENISYVRSAFPQAEYVGGSTEKGRGLVSGPRRSFETNYDPTPLQIEAFSASRGKKLFAFFEKPGAGKTKMVLDKAVDMWCSGEIDGLFVFSYSGVHEQWIMDEAPKHLAKGLAVRSVAWRAGKKLDEAIFEPDPDIFRIFTMNYESYAASPKGFAAAKRFAYSGAIMAVADESQRLKTHDSSIGEKMVANREDWAVRVLASGEPTPLGIQDYYNQFAFLDPAIVGAWTYVGFRSMYCRMGGFDNTQIVGYHNQENLHRLMAPYVHVGAPDIDAKLLFEVSKFSLSDRVRSAYDQLKAELMIDLAQYDPSSGVYRLRSELSKMIKLREIVCGRLTDRDGKVHQIGSERMDLLMSLSGIYSGKKAVVWSCFKEDHRLQLEAYGPGRAAVINGDTPKAQRREIVLEFKDPSSKLQYLIGSPASLGTGWNLQGSCWLNLYYCSDNNAGNLWQSWKRLYRLGVDRDVLNIDIVARNTVDVSTLNSNRRKRDISDMSVEEFKRLITENEADINEFELEDLA